MRIRVTDKLFTLRKQLNEENPGKTATETLLLATWNIREPLPRHLTCRTGKNKFFSEASTNFSTYILNFFHQLA